MEPDSPEVRLGIGSRLLLVVLQAVSWVLARGPEALPRWLSAGVGDLLYWLLRGRARIALVNLRRAFPERDEGWVRTTARTSFRRLVETALFSLALPSLRPADLRERFNLEPGLGERVLGILGAGKGFAVALPHVALWEAMALLPLLLGEAGKGLPYGTVYRPQKQPAVESWIRSTRSRFGVRLFSRRDGLLGPMRFVAKGGILGVLIDQNAGGQGALDLFLGRLASATTFQGMIAERCRAEAWIFWPERTGFWRATVRGLPLAAGTEGGVTCEANDRLGELLTGRQVVCESWLWSHNRWRCEDGPANRLRLTTKRSLVTGAAAVRRVSQFPRKTRFVFILGAAEGAADAWLRLESRVRAGRPDAQLLVVAPLSVQLPADRTDHRMVAGSRWEPERPGEGIDCVFALEADRVDVERACRLGARQRLGWLAGGEPSGGLLLEPAEPFPAGQPVADRWSRCLEAFGLEP